MRGLWIFLSLLGGAYIRGVMYGGVTFVILRYMKMIQARTENTKD